ncbi:MAG: M20 metallopeptidase family protein [Chloroflexota bacterium]
MDQASDIAATVSARAEDLVRLRRDLHQNPEVGFQETRTASVIAERLQGAGIPARTEVGGTGVVGVLDGASPGRTLMIRADIDALPVRELTGLPFASGNGNMHACGHDGHIAMAIGAAETLAGLREQLAGRVVFVFQPAEEFVEGAKAMIADRVIEDYAPDRVIGLHLWNQYPTGFIGVNPQTVFASADIIRITVRGRGGHGALPHQAVDPVVIAAHIVSALQTIVSREIPPSAMGVVTIGAIKGGSAGNVIADEVVMHGTVRAYLPEVREAIFAAIERTATGIASAMRGEAELETLHGTPPVVNDPVVAGWVTDVARQAEGATEVGEHDPVSVGDDMAEFLQRVPGCYFLLGAGGPDRYPHHNARFDFDEACLTTGVEVFVRAATDYLRP